MSEEISLNLNTEKALILLSALKIQEIKLEKMQLKHNLYNNKDEFKTFKEINCQLIKILSNFCGDIQNK